jgi:hypothetical protein
MSDLSRRVPADRGLSGLGLIMQLAGSVFGALTTAVGIAAVIEASETSRYERTDSSALLWILLVTGTGLVRSILHRQAGSDLIYSHTPFAGIKKYFVASMVNAVAWLAFLGGQAHAPSSALVPLLMLLVSWPIALLVITGMPGYREMQGQVPASEDKGFEGASILMLMFGLLGAIGTSLVLYAMWTGSPSEAHSSGSFMLIVIALIVLIIRSVLHVAAARTGLTESRIDQAVAAVNRYCDFGVIAGFIAGGCFLMSVMILEASAIALAVISCFVWALLAWPLTLRRFFGERQFADLMANAEGAGVAHKRAPDLGLSTLGWFLFAQALIGLSLTLPMTLMLPSGGEGGLEAMGPFGPLSAMLGNGLGHSPWWSIGLQALQLWAGIELIRMGELHRIAASAWGALSTVITIYFFWPVISHIGELGREMGGSSMMLVTTFGALALQLTVPVVTLYATNRGARA